MEYGGFTILQSPIFIELILPFVLIFTVVFAVLQKSQIFGEGKKQIDALVALVVGLIFVAFGQAVGFVLNIIPFMAVSVVVILVLMILLGMFNKAGDWDAAFPKGLRTVMMFVVVIAVVIATMLITGAWDYLRSLLFFEGGANAWVVNVIFIVVIGGAVAAVVWGSKGGGKD